jgi:hypothetical protein
VNNKELMLLGYEKMEKIITACFPRPATYSAAAFVVPVSMKAFALCRDLD